MAVDKNMVNFEGIVNNIIKLLEAGVKPWNKPWDSGHSIGLPLNHEGKAYRGANVFFLWISKMNNGFQGDRWLTFNQIRKLGGKVLKGSKGTKIIFWKPIVKSETVNADGSKEQETFPLLRWYTVFNVDQTTDLPEEFYEGVGDDEEIVNNIKDLAEVEAMVNKLNVLIRHEGHRAFYNPTVDYIGMPPKASFKETEGYYSTLFHELTHWTGHNKRCNRKFGDKFGDNAYAVEELVAELGACFLSAHFGIAVDVREENAAYLQSWIKVLKENPKVLLTVAGKAQQAFDYVVNGGKKKY